MTALVQFLTFPHTDITFGDLHRTWDSDSDLDLGLKIVWQGSRAAKWVTSIWWQFTELFNLKYLITTMKLINIINYFVLITICFKLYLQLHNCTQVFSMGAWGFQEDIGKDSKSFNIWYSFQDKNIEKCFSKFCMTLL